ncbi:MAG: hypothetical protein VW378_06195 [bacterium]
MGRLSDRLLEEAVDALEKAGVSNSVIRSFKKDIEGSEPSKLKESLLGDPSKGVIR